MRYKIDGGDEHKQLGINWQRSGSQRVPIMVRNALAEAHQYAGEDRLQPNAAYALRPSGARARWEILANSKH